MKNGRIIRVVSLFMIPCFTTSCAMVRNELRSSGGAGGDILDARMFPATQSKQLQLLRGAILIAVASRMAMGSIRDGREADAFVDYLKNATSELNYMSGHLWPIKADEPPHDGTPVTNGKGAPEDRTRAKEHWPCASFKPISSTTTASPAGGTSTAAKPLGTAEASSAPKQSAATKAQAADESAPNDPPTAEQLSENTFNIDLYRSDCVAYTALFEADVPDLEYKIVRLVVASLPQKQAKQFLDAIKGGNVLGMAWKFLKLAEAAGDGLHRGAAAYRSSQEIVAQALIASSVTCQAWPAETPGYKPPSSRATAGSRPTAILTIEDAITCIGLPHDRLFGDEGELPPNKWPDRLSREAFIALFALAQSACHSLPVALDAPAGGSVDIAPIKQRWADCFSIHFEPKLRYGGLVKMRAIGTPDPQITPTPTPGPTATQSEGGATG